MNKLKNFQQFNEGIKPKKKKVVKKTFIPIKPAVNKIPNVQDTDSELMDMNTPS